MSKLTVLAVMAVALVLTGCATTENLSEGMQSKAIAASGNVFMGEVTPKDAITNAPTGKILLANIEYTSTPLSEGSKNYGYKKTVTTPVVFGLFGGSTTITTIVTGNTLEEIQAIDKTLNPPATP